MITITTTAIVYYAIETERNLGLCAEDALYKCTD